MLAARSTRSPGCILPLAFGSANSRPKAVATRGTMMLLGDDDDVDEGEGGSVDILTKITLLD